MMCVCVCDTILKVGDKRQKSVDRFHRHFYVNGTQCDLTGRARDTEVRVSILVFDISCTGYWSQKADDE